MFKNELIDQDFVAERLLYIFLHLVESYIINGSFSPYKAITVSFLHPLKKGLTVDNLSSTHVSL